jgi:hypothetical protein
MADISLKIRAEALGKTMENLAPQVEEEINSAVKNLAHAAYTAMTAKIQSMSMNVKNRKDYLSALKFKDVGDDSYIIYLDGEWANKLENGFGSYSIREMLLKSQKIVGVGSRAGEPWVRKAKDGHKYAAVPFEHKPHAGSSGDLAADIKALMGKGRDGQQQSISKIFKNAEGTPMSGKVATAIPADNTNPNLVGLTKYQSVSPSGKVSSIYMTYRMVSENGKDWIHPGHSGYQLFKEAEDFVEKEMDNIIKTLLK